MKRTILLFLISAFSQIVQAQQGQPLTIQNQGVTLGSAFVVNCGTNITCSIVSGVATFAASGGGGGVTYPAGTGIVRVAGGTAWGTTAELSQDATTSGSNVVTVVGLNKTLLSGLATGLLKNTTGTGVPSIAVAGTDYVIPSGSITGTASNLSGTPTLPNGTAAATQTAGDSSADIATDSFVTTAVANAVAGVNPAVAVLAASTGPLTGTYTQVGGGIGDTFTVTATGAFTLDGISINTIGQRVLLKNQATASQNGVYAATVVGTTGISPIFTRALDYDTPSDVNNTGAIPVQSGTVNTATSWLLTSQVTSIGSAGSALTYTQFSINPTTIVPSSGSLGIGYAYINPSGQIATTSSAGALATFVNNPIWFDDFLNGATTSVQIGALGWATSTISGGTNTVTHQVGTAPHIGIVALNTAATSGDGIAMGLTDGSTIALGNFSTGMTYDSFWIFEPQTQAVSAGQLYIGFETAGNTAGVPPLFFGVRFDTTLKDVASATCNDAGNKCGLTTLTCSSSQTVTFSINGGTATGSVACTGTNAIANSTAITVVSAGAGYNSTGGAAVGTVTGGTATATGSIALTTTLGAAASGADTDYMLCITVPGAASQGVCSATATAPSVAWQKVEISSPASGQVNISFFGATNNLLTGPISFCASGCTVTATPITNNMVPAVSIAAAANTATIVYLDLWAMQPIGALAR